MKPDSRVCYDPTPAHLRHCIAATGLPQHEIAARVGISRRMLGYYLSGDYTYPYSVQYCIEQLGEKDD